MAKAKWTTDPRKIVATSNADGSFHGEVPLLDGGTLALTLVLDVTAEREVHLHVKGEQGQNLHGFTATSNVTAAGGTA